MTVANLSPGSIETHATLDVVVDDMDDIVVDTNVVVVIVDVVTLE